jgi:hypothetical protein
MIESLFAAGGMTAVVLVYRLYLRRKAQMTRTMIQRIVYPAWPQAHQ